MVTKINKTYLKYEGEVTYMSQIVNLSTYAVSLAKARQNIIAQYAKQVNKMPMHIAAYFKQNPESIKVTLSKPI